MARLGKQKWTQIQVRSTEELEAELKKSFCPNCPIARWRFTAATRGNTLVCGVQWSGKRHSGYGIWMFPPDTAKSQQRTAKHLVAEAPSLSLLCECKS